MVIRFVYISKTEIQKVIKHTYRKNDATSAIKHPHSNSHNSKNAAMIAANSFLISMNFNGAVFEFAVS